MTEIRQDVNQAVRWQQEVDLYTEELVRAADQTLNERRMHELTRTMRTSQLNNLLGVALEAAGAAPVQNWVLYQMGRRETSRAWKQSGFGNDVLKDFGKIREYAEQIGRDVFQSGDKRLIQKTEIALLRLYVGYLKRWFVARGGQG